MRLRGALAVKPVARMHSWRRLFIGPTGLRAGWRVALFIAILGALMAGLLAGLVHAPVIKPWLKRIAAAPGGLPPAFFAFNETVLLLPVLAATGAMAFFEGVSPASYGLQSHAPRRLLAGGGLAGFVALSMLAFIMLATGAAVMTASGGGITADFSAGAAWLAIFCLVAVVEEMAFRGYLLITLTRAIGFWPAAVLTSLLFGAAHGQNPGETPIGLIATIVIGLVLCLSIRLTGSLFWAIGFHAMWDWAESFVYGCHDSGNSTSGRLMDFLPRGNVYLSGGATGPEGSVFVFLVCGVLVALLLAVRGLRPWPPEALKS
jgi:membrane protease YdiL (CAAX protease family)